MHPRQHISEFGSIIDDCSSIFSLFSQFMIGFVRRQVHWPAKVPLFKTSPHSYYQVPTCNALWFLVKWYKSYLPNI